jgi:hypothetical protein
VTDALMYHYDGSSWSSITPALPSGWLSGNLYGAWGSGANDVYAVGPGYDSSGNGMPLMYHYDGSSWSSITPALPSGLQHGYLYGAWGSGANDIYAVGFGADGSWTSMPLIYHYDGSSWSSITPALPSGWLSGNLFGAWGSGANDVYAVGAGSLPLIYHGVGSDTTPPVVTVPSDITEEATSASGAVVNFTVSATDETSPANPSVSCDWPSGSTFPLGATPVTCSATDDAGNTGYGYFNVTVVDTTPPSLTLPANIIAEATGPGGATVNYVASASDLVGVTSFSCAPASGSTFPLGLTTVNCSASDAAGNSANGSFTVTIVDTTPPSLNLPVNILAEATGPGGRVVSYTATASDLVGVTSFSCAPASGSTFPLGTTTVNCSASDAAGNSANGSFTITIVDTTAPTLTLPANITVPQTIPAGAIVTFTASATDLVAPLNPVVACAPPSGSTFPVGTTTVSCSATDTAGNTANGSFTVTVNAAAGGNLLLNPGYDQIVLFPRAWQYSIINVPFSSLADCTVFLSPNCSLKLTVSKTTAIVTQTVSYAGAAGNQFSFGLFSRALNVATAGTYKVEVALFDRFNRVMLTQFLTFNNGTHGFEMVNGQFTAPAAFTKIRYRIYFQKSVGTAWFDDAFLYRTGP